MEEIGIAVRDGVLAFAGTLKDPSVPGLVVLLLFLACGLATIALAWDMRARRRALRRLASEVAGTDKAAFAAEGFETVSAWVKE